jgi:hypothetical protein
MWLINYLGGGFSACVSEVNMFVACKIPNGLTISGNGKMFTLRGASHESLDVRTRQSGYAITRDVPQAIWDDWFEKHKDSEVVENNLVVADDSEQILVARLSARRFRTAKSGLEPGGPGGKGFY